jgi:hypothetical protein
MNIWRNRGDEHRLVESPRQEIEAEIDSLDALIDQLAQLAEATPNDSVRLGGIKTKMEAQARRLELKRAVGILPPRLAVFREDDDVRMVSALLVDVLKRHGVSIEARREVVASLRADSLEEHRVRAWKTTPPRSVPFPNKPA